MSKYPLSKSSYSLLFRWIYFYIYIYRVLLLRINFNLQSIYRLALSLSTLYVLCSSLRFIRFIFCSIYPPLLMSLFIFPYLSFIRLIFYLSSFLLIYQSSLVYQTSHDFSFSQFSFFFPLSKNHSFCSQYENFFFYQFVFFCLNRKTLALFTVL